MRLLISNGPAGRATLAGVLFAAALTGALYGRVDPLLVYKEKHIRVWLLELGDKDSAVRAQAKSAVRRIGPAGLPWVVKLLQTPETWTRRQLLRAGELGRWLPIHVLSASDLQDCGISACIELGRDARSAREDLLAILRQRPSGHVADALATTGFDVIPALRNDLANGDEEVRIWSAYAIGRAAVLARHPSPQSAGVDLLPTAEMLSEITVHDEPRVQVVANWALERLFPTRSLAQGRAETVR